MKCPECGSNAVSVERGIGPANQTIGFWCLACDRKKAGMPPSVFYLGSDPRPTPEEPRDE